MRLTNHSSPAGTLDVQLRVGVRVVRVRGAAVPAQPRLVIAEPVALAPATQQLLATRNQGRF